ncbi:MAG: rRNA maturation RNase YbeY [Candidatus Cloacimonetes bacterium]|nr:rRNA maturation RNase YbeY [Candidatus Cloacimonadota bacterium]MCF7813525.1 rRNA maturation RNase YbeY [Candidatus Cloacimonadota bacterium]MCF7868691.1 rRNA maturation RNase YbeY [Candidatus Cloacimonadota bacterium]MCF7884179.1 rRNA maturation RNase YbeY [Candidatus Cloacimonadota bacterium]
MESKVDHVILDNKAEIELDDDPFSRIMKILIVEEDLDKDSFVNLRLSNNSEIQNMNKKYLGRDELTDVISFSSEMPGIPFLGDIIIDTNVANKQKEKRTLQDELALLFLHGLLHLLNYDHLDTRKAEIMKEKEKRFFEKYKEKI